MKTKKFLTLQNIVIIISALFIAYRIYAMLPVVEKHDERLNKLEKDNVSTEIQLRYHTELLTEMRADIKRLLFANKINEK